MEEGEEGEEEGEKEEEGDKEEEAEGEEFKSKKECFCTETVVVLKKLS